MANELVNKGEDDGVGRGNGVETGARGQGQENTGGEDKEEERSRQQVHPHLS